MNNYKEFANDEMFLKKIGNIYISQEQIDILEKYNININEFKNVKELIFTLEQILNNNSDMEDLEWVSSILSEYNYYANTNK